MRPTTIKTYSLAALVVIVLAIAAIGAGYWPGIMIDDARWQYQQSVDNSYEDWHPPLMAWIWRQLMFIQPGPAPMFVLQLALLGGGLGLVTYWAIRRGRPRLALGIALTSLLPAPLALSGTITKDCLMAGALMMATGLGLTRDLARRRTASLIASAASVGFIAFAAALRLNAVVACVPLLLAVLPRELTRTKARLFAVGLLGALMLFAVGPAIKFALQAEQTDVGLSLIIFDLGGITERSGVNVFPDLNVPHPVAANHRCYDPLQWDTYSTWAKKPCPLGFERFQNAKDEDDFSPLAIWLAAILHHPLAYAQHRLTHFNLSTAFLMSRGPDFTAWSQSVPNPWGYTVGSNTIIRTLTALADAGAETPIGWPIFWISVALAAVVGSGLMKAPAVVTALASSSFLYGMSYLLFGVAVGMRYYFWTITGGAVAAVLVIGELTSRKARPSRAAIAIPAAIIVLPTTLAALARALS
jgi:hypothetical protein